MQLTGLAGRVAVVTGAASGIGQAVVRRLAAERVRLAVVDIYESGLDRLCGELGEAAAPEPFVADLTDPLEVADVAKRVLGEVGNASFLVNVAGGPVAPSHENPLPRLPGRAFPIEEIDDVDWTRILATNLTTAFLVCRAFVPALKAQRFGRIVNFTSIAARRGSDRVGVHYAAAKGGVIGLTKTLALELGPHGITVNAIAPGFINTERMEAAAWGRRTPEQHQALLAAIPLGRLGRPDDVAGIVALLCSDQGGYVSGATIDVNGGLYFGP
jgi:3-oxoacyl-[acyl-carrier protein] reductase